MSFHLPSRRFAPLAFALLLCSGVGQMVRAQQGAALPVEGEMKRWHTLTFDFAGPATSESATPNPFTDYRMDVTFTHPASGATLLVPGFFAADGGAADSSASSGNVWRVHFAPERVGDWTYSISFRSGTNVATADGPAPGASAGYFDGLQGSFTIAPSDKTGRDFRGKGRLDYVGRHHLRFAGTGEYFMKAGVDSPENLLSYADFDGDFKTDGQKDELVKTWAPHVADWQPGDPTWQGDKGKGLIGALNYLASEGLNSVSFLTMNINGDDKNVFPYTTYGERSRLDVSRLDQWETIFEHATRKGFYLHFKTQETENELLLDNGNLGPQRKLYYRELIARFSHHLALNWNLGEEINNATTAQKAAWAQFFHDNDPYHHPIVIHNGDQHFDLMGPQFALTGMSLQLNEANFSDTFTNILRYVRRSDQYGKAWVVGCDEPGNASASLRPDSDPGTSHTDARRDALWATIMAGGAGCEFYFGSNYPNSDMTCQDFRSRDAFWDYCRHALTFFKENTFAFELMSNQNELVSGYGDNGNRCLAKIGDTYLIQLRSGGTHTLDLTGTTGSFTVKWFDPRNGGTAIPAADLEGGGIVSLGSPPASPTEDWIVLVKSTSGASATNRAPTVTAGADRQAFLTGETVSFPLEGVVSDDGLPDPAELAVAWTMVSGPAPVTFAQPNAAATQITFTTGGTYVLSLAANDSDLDAHDEITVTISLPTEGNLPPVYNGYAFITSVNEPLSLPYGAILASASDPDGDPVSPVMTNGSSSQGGQVVMEAGHLTYAPSIDYFGPDSFVLTVGDGRGGFTTATITVQVAEAGSIPPPTSSPGLLRVGEGVMRFRYFGAPGANYTLERSTDLATWTTLATDLSGEIDYLDTAAPTKAAFYRIVAP
ncbi:DUF5060 domain-containing protein [Luteolibacter soli]|uniref:DUF5060 domain-containing protein n=1 Tax=Luteolibacter soli TaxID=3135280 RepID=A0ABU9AT83_9BACT